MITSARARFIRVSARKARLVLDQIRGKSVGDALATLEFTPRAAARLIEKVLRSAVANAEHNHQVRNLDDLRVVQAVADGGPSLTAIVRWLVRCLMKNARPIARGCTRLSDGPPSATACTTRRSSRLRTWWLCSANRARITIFTARPGIIIGRKGSEVERLKNELQMRTQKEIYLNIEEVIHPELDAQLVSENVALQLQKRVAFRRAMKKAVTSALRLGADGIRIACAGRLGGGEIARREWYRDGRVPLHTIRADIDFGMATAHTTAGTIGVKVWIFKGEVLRAAPAEA